MSLIAKSSGNGDFELTPEGAYIARCIKVIDMGTQTRTGQFGTKSKHEVMISWELLDQEVKMKDGKPFAASKFYTVSLAEKANLRKDLEAWRGKKFTQEELDGFDLKNILGTYCYVQVVHSEDGQYANINSIMSYKGDKPQGVNDLMVFDMSNPDINVFNSFSDKMKEKIQSTPEWRERQKALDQFTPDEVIEDIDDTPINLDDIPFGK